MKYQYHGPLSGLHIPGDIGDVVLIGGRAYELPADNDDVKRLVAQKHLTVLPGATKTASKGDSNAG